MNGWGWITAAALTLWAAAVVVGLSTALTVVLVIR